MKKTFWMAIAIFCLSAFFRIFFLDLIEFKYDEAYTVFELEKFFTRPYLMQVGPPQSTGVYNPPLFNYIMILLSLFSRHPQYLSFLIALINSVFVVIFYLVVKKFYSPITALVAGLLLATSPWSILFSRKIWIPDLLVPFTILAIYFLHKLIVEKKIKFTLPLFTTLALLPQMHASGGFFLLTTIIIFIFLKVKIDIKKAFSGFVLGLVPAIPYFWRQLTSNPFCVDCQAFLSYQETAKAFDFMVFLRPFEFINGLNFAVVLGGDYQLFWQTFSLSSVAGVIFLLGTSLPLIGIYSLIRSKNPMFYMGMYIAIMPLLYFLTRTPSYMHYFVIISPFVFLTAAFGLRYLKNIIPSKIGLVLGGTILLTILATNFLFEAHFYNFLGDKKIIKGEYGPIFPLSEQFTKENLQVYQLLPDYDLLKSYTYMFIQTNLLHQKVGDYFLQTNRPQLAIPEFRKALVSNNQDIYSRSNLIYLLKVMGKTEEAQQELKILDEQNSTAAAQLKSVLEKLPQ